MLRTTSAASPSTATSGLTYCIFSFSFFGGLEFLLQRASPQSWQAGGRLTYRRLLIEFGVGAHFGQLSGRFEGQVLLDAPNDLQPRRQALLLLACCSSSPFTSFQSIRGWLTRMKSKPPRGDREKRCSGTGWGLFEGGGSLQSFLQGLKPTLSIPFTSRLKPRPPKEHL